MISRLASLITPSRVMTLLVAAVLVLLLSLDPSMIKPAIAVLLALGALCLIALWVVRRVKAHRAAEGLKQMIAKEVTTADGDDIHALRDRLRAALETIKSSRLGGLKGASALYELPWYMVIGNPSAGKSSALLNSGLHFPFTDHDGRVIEGIGGTRNCDWYFTTEGVLLDTAGRYSVHEADRAEWLSFLHLLKKYRPRAPINGVIIAASIAELMSKPPEFAIELGKKLRQRIQELTDNLEVIAPVYIVFTKADLIQGFADFFREMEPAQRERVWGATFTFSPDDSTDALAYFERYFEELCDGLNEMSLAQMAANRDKIHAPGLLTLPLEFKALRDSLRTFLTTLFEDNPYQYRPVIRGFYFTSALQENPSLHQTSDSVASRFGLEYAAEDSAGAEQVTRYSYFLLDLFRKVIFSDKQLVQQHASKRRSRQRSVVVFASIFLLGGGLAGWTASYTNNRQLVSNVEADLRKVISIQQDRADLQVRLEGLEVLQDRLEQLRRYKDSHPVMLGLGLYQGDAVEEKLWREYFYGMSELMLKPVTVQMENYLTSVAKSSASLKQQSPDASGSQATPGGIYQAPSPTDVQQAYNALKAYLMLSNAQRVEPTHLGDQLTRFWRHWLEANRGGMDREVMASRAERLMSFYINQSAINGWPVITARLTIVEQARVALNGVMQGLPARDRVYAEIKARAATRFPSVTVAALIDEDVNQIFAGSYAISGAFSRQAWEGYVKSAIRDAANKELNTSDWVLQTSRSDDLTLSGSPEHIEKELHQLYTQEYILEWRKFLQGITVTSFDDLSGATAAMNQLGDPQNSPMRKLIEAVHAQTSWDNPTQLNDGTAQAEPGWWASLTGGTAEKPETLVQASLPTGTVGREFSGIDRLMATREGAPTLLQNYLEVLSRIRTRLNAIQTQGSPGPGARELVLQTLDASNGSELSVGLLLVEEQMLSSMDDGQRRTLRPLLLWPMIQTFSAAIPATQRELNQVWNDQVNEPFRSLLAGKYPSLPTARSKRLAQRFRKFLARRVRSLNTPPRRSGP